MKKYIYFSICFIVNLYNDISYMIDPINTFSSVSCLNDSFILKELTTENCIAGIMLSLNQDDFFAHKNNKIIINNANNSNFSIYNLAKYQQGDGFLTLDNNNILSITFLLKNIMDNNYSTITTTNILANNYNSTTFTNTTDSILIGNNSSTINIFGKQNIFPSTIFSSLDSISFTTTDNTLLQLTNPINISNTMNLCSELNVSSFTINNTQEISNDSININENILNIIFDTVNIFGASGEGTNFKALKGLFDFNNATIIINNLANSQSNMFLISNSTGLLSILTIPTLTVENMFNAPTNNPTLTVGTNGSNIIFQPNTTSTEDQSLSVNNFTFNNITIGDNSNTDTIILSISDNLTIENFTISNAPDSSCIQLSPSSPEIIYENINAFNTIWIEDNLTKNNSISINDTTITFSNIDTYNGNNLVLTSNKQIKIQNNTSLNHIKKLSNAISCIDDNFNNHIICKETQDKSYYEILLTYYKNNTPEENDILKNIITYDIEHDILSYNENNYCALLYNIIEKIIYKCKNIEPDVNDIIKKVDKNSKEHDDILTQCTHYEQKLKNAITDLLKELE